MNKPEIAKVGVKKDAPKKITREELSRQIKKMRERDAELVTGIFKNLENPGTGSSRGALVFGFKAYPGDEYTFYELLDGERYTIPRGVARHLNNNCFFKEYQHLPGEYGNKGIRTAMNPEGRLNTSNFQMAKKIHRFAFHSLEFMDDDPDMNPTDIVEVTVSP